MNLYPFIAETVFTYLLAIIRGRIVTTAEKLGIEVTAIVFPPPTDTHDSFQELA